MGSILSDQIRYHTYGSCLVRLVSRQLQSLLNRQTRAICDKHDCCLCSLTNQYNTQLSCTLRGKQVIEETFCGGDVENNRKSNILYASSLSKCKKESSMGVCGFCRSPLCKYVFCLSPVSTLLGGGGWLIVDTGLSQNTCFHSGKNRCKNPRHPCKNGYLNFPHLLMTMMNSFIEYIHIIKRPLFAGKMKGW